MCPEASRPQKEVAAGKAMNFLLLGSDSRDPENDGGSRSDIPSWAKDTGNELLESSNADGIYRYFIRKK